MKIKFFLAAITIFSFASAYSQDQDSVSMEDLKRYAVMMDSIDNMRTNLLAQIEEIVKSNEQLSVARYNELSKIASDTIKLQEANATPEELSVISKIETTKKGGAKDIQETFQNMAKDYVGVSTYNKIRKAIKEDPTVKSKLQALQDELKAEAGG